MSSIQILPALAALPLLAGLLGGCGYDTSAPNATVGPAPDNAPLVAIEKFKAPAVLATNAPMPGETFARATQAMAFGENSTVGGSGNTVSSPATLALAGTALLQSSNGNTRQSLADWLFFPKNGGAALADVGPPDLSAFTVNGQQPYSFSSIMWGQAGYLFSKDYLGTLSSTFQGELVGVDFLSGSDNNARLIAASVEHHLGATFPRDGVVLSTPTTNTRAVLASALAWDSAWRNANGTAADLEKVDGLWEALDRTESDLRQRRVPMVKWQGRFAKYDRATFKAVKIPLGNGATTLTVIMPTKDGFSAIESHLNDVLGEFDSGSSMQEIEFMLPVFSVTTHSDIAAPMGGNRTYAKNCTKRGYCVDDATRIASTTEDYSGVNGAGYLYRDKFDVTTTIDVSERGLASKSLAAVTFKATEDEPQELFQEGYGSNFSFGSGVTITQQLFPDFAPCTLTYEAEGPTQARPFIFIGYVTINC